MSLKQINGWIAFKNKFRHKYNFFALKLHRLFGRQSTLRILRNLKGVYISHLHADHHMGFISIVNERNKAFDFVGEPIKKLFILAPSRIAAYLTLYHRKFEPVLTHLHQISNEHLLVRTTPSNPDIKTQTLYPSLMQELLEANGLLSVKTCRVISKR